MRRLKNYDPEQGAKPETYFRIIVRHLSSRFFEKDRGHFRLPTELRKQNDFLMCLIYRLLCWEKMPETEAAEYVRHSAHGGRSASVIREGLRIIRDRYPNCGKKEKEEIPIDEEEISSSGRTPEEEVIFQEWQKICRAILNSPDNDTNTESDRAKIKAIREKLRRKFKPETDQRLLLRMIYQDGMSVKDAAKKLGWTPDKAHGHRQRLLKKLHSIIADDLKHLTDVPS